MKKIGLISLIAVFGFAMPATAKDINILVAQKGSDAYKYAKSIQNKQTIFAEKKIHKAFSRVQKLFASGACPVCPQPRVRGLAAPACNIPEQDWCTINIKVTAGLHKGKGGNSGFGLNPGIQPQTTLRILGGYDGHFKNRAPFITPTLLKAGGTIFTISGKNHKLRELYISGFVMDIAGSNVYDPKSNSIKKGESRDDQHIVIGYLEAERLVYADNVFVNSSHKAAAPLLRAHGNNATITVRNNIILNNIIAWEADSARFATKPSLYSFEGNSFLMNWPYNPDPTTSNPGTLQLGGSSSTAKFMIKDNIFAYNIGSAIHITSTSDQGPPETEFVHNLFYMNGSLFGESEPGAAVIAAKFGGFKNKDVPWNVINLEALEDDYEWENEDNVAFDPKININHVNPLFANSASVHANNSTANTIRGMLGQNKQGGSVKIKDFAPAYVLDLKHLPFPQEPKAKGFGANSSRVEQF